VTHEQIDDILTAGEYGVLDDRFLRISIGRVSVRPMLQQPLGALRMLRHSVAEQVIDGADAEACARPAGRSRPSARFPTLLRFRPEQLEPEGRVRIERSVVKRLWIERIGPARDQQTGKGLCLRVSGLPALAAVSAVKLFWLSDQPTLALAP